MLQYRNRWTRDRARRKSGATVVMVTVNKFACVDASVEAGIIEAWDADAVIEDRSKLQQAAQAFIDRVFEQK